MAELNTGDGGGKKGGKIRSKKAGGRVDLTAMVDLAFLLITFFMLTTSISKPYAMDVAMPDKNKENQEDQLDVADNRTLTVLLGSDDKIAYYMGLLESPIQGPEVVDYGKNGIRPILLEKIKEVPQITGDPEKGLIVIIRPSDRSNYKNLVDILDEMKIVNATQYMIGDIGEAEIALLENQAIYNE
ncbi:ExbD/TolR family protein [Albibacterium indicum]|uniref:ExbD/TolR family protein n=1 Tax=Albibacterium indicum TaxID=2292082 RepID=UPI000E51BB0B|nr:biopolymer transporter ExbD [Pedobacter indicus]